MSTRPESHPEIVIYYDGLCILCSREIEVYRRKDVQRRIRFTDISAPGFDARVYGLDPQEVQQVLHVQRLSGGEVYRGVAAFIEVWKVLPGLNGLARLAQTQWLRAGLEAGYRIFAWVRPYLPRKRVRLAECGSGACVRGRVTPVNLSVTLPEAPR